MICCVSVGPGTSWLAAETRFSPAPTAHEIFSARIFEEPLLPIGGKPSAEENSALAAALEKYVKRSSRDDFTSLTTFLGAHPRSPWRASLLLTLGLEYFNAAHYSKTIPSWNEAWSLAKETKEAKGKAVADRAAGELAMMFARLGRMGELDAFLKSVEGRVFVGSATEKIAGAREALWNMQNRPEISFRCGPLALQRIKLACNADAPGDEHIANSASTQQGFSLAQVAELSKKLGMNYQMAFRRTVSERESVTRSDGATSSVLRVADPRSAKFFVPSVVHWKVGHYAALIRRDGNRYLLQDPTFGSDVWATEEALNQETSGYFLIPPGPLPKGWRTVELAEGEKIFGKGVTGNNDPGPLTPRDPQTGGGSCRGMAVSGVHLMLVSLNIRDEPVGHTPPIGPEVRFTVRYNHRDAFQPANFDYPNFGPKWTCDWIAYLTDNPQNPSADVRYYVMGGGSRLFTGFNAASQTFAYQQYDQTLLRRTGTNSYEMVERDGSKLVFESSGPAIGTSRRLFLSRVVDPFGNAVTLGYNNGRLINLTDAIGQVTTITYLSDDVHNDGFYRIARVTDPFGRFATFEYAQNLAAGSVLRTIRDVLGLESRFVYYPGQDFIYQVITPYGTNAFLASSGGGPFNTTRVLETTYPDGSRDRVEFNQSTNLVASSEPSEKVPLGLNVFNQFLHGRNTYYWTRNACAQAYGDYSKARIYHWLHAENIATTSGILESTKEPLENRVWYNYNGQTQPYHTVGTSSRPTRVGRVLDDGTTQLHTYTYDGFGHVTSETDPLGRRFSYSYSTNGIDLLEVRQTRGSNNELLARMTYNAQHQPLTQVDAAGQTNSFTYNARGQILTTTNPKGETTTYSYDTNGYLLAVDGPLPGTNDTVRATYDSFGRMRTKTDESGYTLMFDYDAMDRLTRITFPDGTFTEYTFNRLDVVAIRDRAGRVTTMEYDSMRQLVKRTDPLNRTTHFQWCSCGDLRSITDPMGRTTSWNKDVQGRLVSKVYGDGSAIRYFYENATSRMREVIDEKQQSTRYSFNRDDTLRSIAYANTAVPTPAVTFTYDANYRRINTMTDGTGTTKYFYNPITAPPVSGAGLLSAVDGPPPNDTLTYIYDAAGERIGFTLNGVSQTVGHDEAGRLTSVTNALGVFTYAYDGASGRVLTETLPNLQTHERAYGNASQDFTTQRLTHKLGPTRISEFVYGRDIARGRIHTWSQQSGAASPTVYAFGYDDADQLLSAVATNAGVVVNQFAYNYDAAANRLSEQVDAVTNVATYNALNQISTSTKPATARTNEWDSRDRLVAVNAGNQRTEFSYDWSGRLVSIRHLTNGVEVSFRRFVWCTGKPCEERDSSGTVIKRFFDEGVKIESGPQAGIYFYTRDHLGSIRELTDSSGAVRARYAYDPYGRRTRVTGDLEADFGFTGLFWSAEVNLNFARFRAYDPDLGRWLSRDPLPDAELREGPNLYSYVAGNPINAFDPSGLCCERETMELINATTLLADCVDDVERVFQNAQTVAVAIGNAKNQDQVRALEQLEEQLNGPIREKCGKGAARRERVTRANYRLEYCLERPCEPRPCKPGGFFGPGITVEQLTQWAPASSPPIPAGIRFRAADGVRGAVSDVRACYRFFTYSTCQ